MSETGNPNQSPSDTHYDGSHLVSPDLASHGGDAGVSQEIAEAEEKALASIRNRTTDHYDKIEGASKSILGYLHPAGGPYTARNIVDEVTGQTGLEVEVVQLALRRLTLRREVENPQLGEYSPVS